MMINDGYEVAYVHWMVWVSGSCDESVVLLLRACSQSGAAYGIGHARDLKVHIRLHWLYLSTHWLMFSNGTKLSRHFLFRPRTDAQPISTFKHPDNALISNLQRMLILSASALPPHLFKAPGLFEVTHQTLRKVKSATLAAA